MFKAFGLAPASEPVKGKVEIHHWDCVKVEARSTRPYAPRLFAAGVLTDRTCRLAVTGAGSMTA